MPRRSYLRQIAGGYPGLAVLSPPRVLFRPATLPTSVLASLETSFPAASPHPRQPSTFGAPAPPRMLRTPQRPSRPVPVSAGSTPSGPPSTVLHDRDRSVPPTAPPVPLKGGVTPTEIDGNAASPTENRPAARWVAPRPASAPSTAPPRDAPDADPITEGRAPPRVTTIVPADSRRPGPQTTSAAPGSVAAPSRPESGGPVSSEHGRPARIAPEIRYLPSPDDPAGSRSHTKRVDSRVIEPFVEITPAADPAVVAIDSPVIGGLDAPRRSGPRVGAPPAASDRTAGSLPSVFPSVAAPVPTGRVDPSIASVSRVESAVPVGQLVPLPAPPQPAGAPVSTSQDVPLFALPARPTQSMPPQPAGVTKDNANARELPGIPSTRAIPHDHPPPFRLEPPLIAPRPQPTDGERSAGVRIGVLDVRIAPPSPAPAPLTRRPPARPPARSMAPLSRGFRSFGLVQG